MRQEHIDAQLALKEEADKEKEAAKIKAIFGSLEKQKQARLNAEKCLRERAESDKIRHDERLKEISRKKEEELNENARKIK